MSDDSIKDKLKILPKVQLVDLDSNRFKMPINEDIIIVYFNTTCGYCLAEIEDIRENIDQLSNYSIILISMETLPTIRNFAKDYNLNFKNLFVTKIRPENVFDAFGSLSNPHVFVYGSDSFLIKEFRGPNTVASMLKSLK